MTATLIVLAVLLVGYILLNMKTSRPDGTWIPNVHKYRRMMFYVMPTRNESIVFYDEPIRADRLLAYIEAAREHFHCDVTHAAVAAAFVGFSQTPKMNRFVAGRRLYQRDGEWVTFGVKRKKKDAEAKLATVKLERHDGENFRQLCERVSAQINVQRSDSKTSHDKEYDLLTAIPRPLLSFGIKAFRWLDYHNILPGSFIEHDPLYTGLFIANLGSLQMGAAFHHLYEWGTCPLFLMIGQIEERAVVVDGKVEVQKILPLRFSYDERIDDGLSSRRGIKALVTALADPFTYLGCVKGNGEDDFAIGDKLVPEEQLRVESLLGDARSASSLRACGPSRP